MFSPNETKLLEALTGKRKMTVTADGLHVADDRPGGAAALTEAQREQAAKAEVEHVRVMEDVGQGLGMNPAAAKAFAQGRPSSFRG